MNSRLYLRHIVTDAGGFFLLATASVCIGLLVNQVRDRQLPLTYLSKAGRVEEVVKNIQHAAPLVAAPAKPAAPQPISLDQFRHYQQAKLGLILDARPEIFYRLGHIPGAISFPREDFDAAHAKNQSLLDRERGQALLVYCSGSSCEDSQMVADGLSKLGYPHVFVFKGGWDEWTEAHLPEEKTE